MAGVAQPSSSDEDEESDQPSSSEEEDIPIDIMQPHRPPTQKISKKRTRPDSDQWVRFDPSEECKYLDDGRIVVFVNGFFDNYPNDRQENWDNPESSKSLCTQYLDWLHPFGYLEVTTSTYAKYIDFWQLADKIYLFKAPGFFYYSNRAYLPEYTHFFPSNYAVDHCMQHGAYRATTLQVVAFYYTKILPPSLRADLYIHKTFIEFPYLVDMDIDTVKPITVELGMFIDATPFGSTGITFVGYPEHAMVLIFDSKLHRLEFYEPNGVDAKYPITKNGPLQSFTIYDYLKTRPNLLLAYGIDTLWGSTFKFQQQGKSCSLWASIMAICRMTGIRREQLPTRTQDVKDLLSTIRMIMWSVCRFGDFQDSPLVSFQDIDRKLNTCILSKSEIDQVLGMVMKHAAYTPIPIPPDEPLDPDEMKVEPSVCPTPWVINLDEVNVTSYFIHYAWPYCQRSTVIVRGSSVVASSEALRLIMFIAASVELEMVELINLSDVDTVATLDVLVAENPRCVMAAKKAVVYAPNTLDLIKKMRGRLLFDNINRAKAISTEATEALMGIARQLVSYPMPWEVTLNLLNHNAMPYVRGLPDDCVDRLICTGPLVGQERPDYMLNRFANSRLKTMMQKSTHVEVPSTKVNIVALACAGEMHHTLHVTEVKTSLSASDIAAFGQLDSCIKRGVLTIDRLVLQFEIDEASVVEVNRLVANVHARIPIYMLLNPVDEKSIDLYVRRMHVRNFIVAKRYENFSPVFLWNFLSKARSVIYRDLYEPPSPPEQKPAMRAEPLLEMGQV